MRKRSSPAPGFRTRSIPRNPPPRRSRGLRGFKEHASATLLEVAFGFKRDDATRLAQRCSLQPHSIARLGNSLQRMRLSPLRSLTSLALSCVSNMLGRGRELQGEWPRTLSADHVSLSA